MTTALPSDQAHPPAADHQFDPAVPVAGDRSVEGLMLGAPEQLLGLSVSHPARGVCVVAVDGELDALTAPLLEGCVRDQLAVGPGHLILNLQRVRFLGAAGLRCLLTVRELAQHTGARLYLAGLVTRAVARPLEVTELLERFVTYRILAHALAALAD